MRELFLSPGRISWFAAVSSTLALLALAEWSRFVGWGRPSDLVERRATSLFVPGLRRLSPAAASARLEPVRARLRPATILPMVVAPMMMLRPPADISTVLGATALIWWLAFALLAIGHGLVSGRTAADTA